jgi:hypothetical protein
MRTGTVPYVRISNQTIRGEEPLPRNASMLLDILALIEYEADVYQNPTL